MLKICRAHKCVGVASLSCLRNRFHHSSHNSSRFTRDFTARRSCTTRVYTAPLAVWLHSQTRAVNATLHRRIHERRVVSPSYWSTSCCACLTWGCDGGSVAWNMRRASRANCRARCKSPNLRQLIQKFKHEMPMCGWLSGSTRRRNSSVFSPITRASWCRPRAEYVAARLLIAAPRAESIILNPNQSISISRRTYQRMVIRQHAPLKLKRLLSHHKSILVTPKS